MSSWSAGGGIGIREGRVVGTEVFGSRLLAQYRMQQRKVRLVCRKGTRMLDDYYTHSVFHDD